MSLIFLARVIKIAIIFQLSLSIAIIVNIYKLIVNQGFKPTKALRGGYLLNKPL